MGDVVSLLEPAEGKSGTRHRIAFFLPHLRHGGVERVVLLLLQNLDRSLFEPILILQRREGDYLRLLDDDVTVIALRRRKPPACVFELARLLREKRVDLLYTATNATNIYGVVAALLARTGTRVVVSEHTPLDFSLSEAKLRLLRRMAMRFAYPRAALTVAPLEEIGGELRAFLQSAAPPFRCLPNPVIEGVAPPRPIAPIALRLMSVGRLSKVKRFDLMIEAFARFHGEHPGSTLTIYGDGPERAELEETAQRLGVGRRVIFGGYVENVPEKLSEADMFLCTSAREGFGNAIVEAMAAGVPVLSVDCPFGPAILLDGGRAGRLVRDSDPEAIADAIGEVACDPVVRSNYVQIGREVAAVFSVKRAVESYSEAFLSLLKDNCRGTAVHVL